MKEVDKKAFGNRLRVSREAADLTQPQLAKLVGYKQQTIQGIEAGGTSRPGRIHEIANTLGVTVDWLLWGESEMIDMPGNQMQAGSVSLTSPQKNSRNDRKLPENAQVGRSVSLTHRIPAFGKAMGGKHGEFVLNGNKIADILAPPELMSVHNAYAVYIAGSSMEPRYFAGEVAFVHPGLPVRKGDFVVAQIAVAEEGQSPLAYVKRFVSLDSRRLKLEQFNPRRTLEFEAKLVVSVHVILMAGRG